MAKEIDEFLMEKFRGGLDEIMSSKSKNAGFSPNFLFDKSLHSNFQEIKDLPAELFRTSPPAEHIKIREKLYCLNDVLMEYQMMSKTDLRTRNNIWKKLTSIKAELNGLKKESNRGSKTPTASKQPGYDVEAGSSRENDVPLQSALPFDESKVYGFKDDVTSLEKVLVRQGSEDRFKNVGIIGKTGIGKTALCRSLFNKKEVKDYFHPRIWVCMSRKPGDDPDGKVTILKRMLVSLGVEDGDQHDLKGLLYALHLQLQGKRYLIVLDDACPWDWVLWEIEEWYKQETEEWYKQLNSSSTCEGKWDCLAYGLPKGFGGAVIVTSRNEELAKAMVGREGFVHSVLPLSDPERSWEIFFNGATEPDRKRLDSDSSINMEILKEQILRKCAGLPLTAQMMGTAYRPAN